MFSSAGEVIGSKSTAPVLDFAAEDCPLSMCGDIKIEVLASAGRHDERLLRFWFHTAMLTREKLVLRKWQLEGPIKDKKHKKWNDDWIGTIRKNAADSNSDTMVIVTTAMPDRMENFGRYEDVFVCQYHELPVVAELLRFAVIKADGERIREEHMLSIQERVVEYVSGPEFANIMRMVMKAYQDFDDDLRREEQYMRKRWKARRGYLKNVIDSIMNMAGRLEQLGAGDYEVMMEIGGDQPPVNLLSESSEPEE